MGQKRRTGPGLAAEGRSENLPMSLARGARCIPCLLTLTSGAAWRKKAEPVG